MDKYQRLIDEGINSPEHHAYAVAIRELLDYPAIFWQQQAGRLQALHEAAEAKLARAVGGFQRIQCASQVRSRTATIAREALAELKGDK